MIPSNSCNIHFISLYPQQTLTTLQNEMQSLLIQYKTKHKQKRSQNQCIYLWGGIYYIETNQCFNDDAQREKEIERERDDDDDDILTSAKAQRESVCESECRLEYLRKHCLIKTKTNILNLIQMDLLHVREQNLIEIYKIAMKIYKFVVLSHSFILSHECRANLTYQQTKNSCVLYTCLSAWQKMICLSKTIICLTNNNHCVNEKFVQTFYKQYQIVLECLFHKV